jgi:hypothetical protein
MKPLIKRKTYGKSSELWEQCQNYTFVHPSPTKRWGSRLLADIIKRVLLGKNHSVRRELGSGPLPIPALQTAVAFVSFWSLLRRVGYPPTAFRVTGYCTTRADLQMSTVSTSLARV